MQAANCVSEKGLSMIGFGGAMACVANLYIVDKAFERAIFA